MKNVISAVAVLCVGVSFGCATGGSAQGSAAPEGTRQEKNVAPDSQTSSTGFRIAEGPLTITRVEWSPSANIESAELRLFTSKDPNCPIDAGAVWAKIRAGEPFNGPKDLAMGEYFCGYQKTRDQNGTINWWEKKPGEQPGM